MRFVLDLLAEWQLDSDTQPHSGGQVSDTSPGFLMYAAIPANFFIKLFKGCKDFQKSFCGLLVWPFGNFQTHEARKSFNFIFLMEKCMVCEKQNLARMTVIHMFAVDYRGWLADNKLGSRPPEQTSD